MTTIAPAFPVAPRAFDDHLSPILVKELRQGMRARLFVLSFLLLQVFLAVLTMASLAAQEDRFVLETQRGFFWTILSLALLVITPLRGLTSISGEVGGRTLETIMLTRMTAWRVVVGKWSALCAQSLLLVSAVLPYIVLRYFLGGEDIVGDLKWVVFLLWLSAILNAASIGLSALGNAIIRIIVMVGILVVVLNVAEGYLSPSFTRTASLQTIAWQVIDGVFICLLLFEMTASAIAPAAENHAARRRGLVVLLFLISMALYWGGGKTFQAGLGLAEVIAIAICFFELAERPRLLRRMVQPFARQGAATRLAGLFFLPGWPSALLFSLVVIPGVMSIFESSLTTAERAGWTLLIPSVLGSILVPVAVCHFFLRKTGQVLMVTILYNLIVGGIAAICEGFQMVVRAKVVLLLALFPSIPTYVVAHNADAFPEVAAWLLLGNSLVVLAVTLILLIESRHYFRQVFAFYRDEKK